LFQLKCGTYHEHKAQVHHISLKKNLSLSNTVKQETSKSKSHQYGKKWKKKKQSIKTKKKLQLKKKSLKRAALTTISSYIEPIYPPFSLRKKEEGVVLLELTISSSGHVKKVIVKKSSGFPRLDKSAMTSAYQWKFTTFKTVPVTTILKSLQFKIPEK